MPHNTLPNMRLLLPASPGFTGRDRVLLYTRGMNQSPAKGVALALRSMRRAGEYAPAAKVMEELFRTLQENEVPIFVATEDGTPLVSTPPINRRVMIAEDMVQFSFFGTLRKWFFSLWATIRGTKGRQP